VAAVVYSIGHSNVSGDELFARVARAGVRTLVDVRAFPASRRNPQFGRDALAEASGRRGVAYHWMPALGGRRRALGSTSPHVAWEVPAFRNYADYADTPEFADALAELEAVARAAPTAFLCAEALWWRCHRRLIADQLLVRGWDVRHIGTDERLTAHRLPDFARVADGRIVYDVGATPSLALPERRRR